MSLKTGINLKKTMFVVTTKCNIKCDNCNSFINKYIFPMSIDGKTLVSDAKNLLEFVDSIEELVILGGETFLNRNLHYLLESLFEGEYSDKVANITISTNGTIIPNIETLKILKKHKAKNTIIISKYFDICETIVPELKKFDINYVINEPSPWRKNGKMNLHHRSEEELAKMYKGCFFRNEYDGLVLKGELHICPISAHAKDLKIIPDYKSDYLNFREGPISSKVEGYNAFNNQSHMHCCDHCEAVLNEIVERTYTRLHVKYSKINKIKEQINALD